VVTSRTAVADQVRYPAGTVVVRLEEFDDDQAGRWLATWNRTNPARPLPTPTALAHGVLARQPLLLFMLALFHSAGGDLSTLTQQVLPVYGTGCRSTPFVPFPWAARLTDEPDRRWR